MFGSGSTIPEVHPRNLIHIKMKRIRNTADKQSVEKRMLQNTVM